MAVALQGFSSLSYVQTTFVCMTTLSCEGCCGRWRLEQALAHSYTSLALRLLFVTNFIHVLIKHTIL